MFCLSYAMNVRNEIKRNANANQFKREMTCNVFISTMNIYVCSEYNGLHRREQNPRKNTMCTTPAYLVPTVWNDQHLFPKEPSRISNSERDRQGKRNVRCVQGDHTQTSVFCCLWKVLDSEAGVSTELHGAMLWSLSVAVNLTTKCSRTHTKFLLALLGDTLKYTLRIVKTNLFLFLRFTAHSKQHWNSSAFEVHNNSGIKASGWSVRATNVWASSDVNGTRVLWTSFWRRATSWGSGLPHVCLGIHRRGTRMPPKNCMHKDDTILRTKCIVLQGWSIYFRQNTAVPNPNLWPRKFFTQKSVHPRESWFRISISPATRKNCHLWHKVQA